MLVAGLRHTSRVLAEGPGMKARDEMTSHDRSACERRAPSRLTRRCSGRADIQAFRGVVESRPSQEFRVCSAGSRTALNAEPLGGHEIDYSETFSVLAELALGLAGFTGVAAAFGGRDRVFSYVDQVRLVGIFLAAGSVLVGCLAVLTLSSAEVSSATTYAWASFAAVSILSPNVYPLVPHTYGFWRDPEISTRGWVFAIVMGQLVACLVLLGGNIASPEVAAWPLVAAFSIQLSYGLFLFARILIVRR